MSNIIMCAKAINVNLDGIKMQSRTKNMTDIGKIVRTIYDNSLSLKFGIEAEGGAAVDDMGRILISACNYIGNEDEEVGCDGDMTPIEYRSKTFRKVSKMVRDIRRAFSEKIWPENVKGIFIPVCRDDRDRYSKVSCGTHITFSFNEMCYGNRFVRNVYADYFQEYIEEKLTEADLNIFEGPLGHRRRGTGGYGSYECRPFNQRTAYPGMEYRVLGSCMSEPRIFKSTVVMYMWLVWTYWWYDFAEHVKDFRDIPVDHSLTPLIENYMFDTDGLTVFDDKFRTITASNKYKRLRQAFHDTFEGSIKESLRILHKKYNENRDFERTCIFDAWNIPKRTIDMGICKICGARDCEICVKKCRSCGKETDERCMRERKCIDCCTCHSCVECRETMSVDNELHWCETCGECLRENICRCGECKCSCTCAMCECNIKFTPDNFDAHLCEHCGKCPIEACDCDMCPACHSIVPYSVICGNCNQCPECCRCNFCTGCFKRYDIDVIHDHIRECHTMSIKEVGGFEICTPVSYNAGLLYADDNSHMDFVAVTVGDILRSDSDGDRLSYFPTCYKNSNIKGCTCCEEAEPQCGECCYAEVCQQCVERINESHDEFYIQKGNDHSCHCCGIPNGQCTSDEIQDCFDVFCSNCQYHFCNDCYAQHNGNIEEHNHRCRVCGATECSGFMCTLCDDNCDMCAKCIIDAL